MPYNPNDGLPDNQPADATDILGLGKALTYLFDPSLSGVSKLRPMTPADLAGAGSGSGVAAPGTGTILGQSSGTIDATSRQLPSVPAGSGYARLQLHGAGISGRYDGATATKAADEELYDAGGTLELLNAAEIAGFRYISQGGTGSYSVIYRSN